LAGNIFDIHRQKFDGCDLKR